MYNSSICLLCKDENEYINEWLEWHINIGFEHFYIFDNESKIPIQKSIDNKFIDKCKIIKWDKSMYIKNMQIECYNYCIKRFKNESKWIAFIDTDEFIRIKNNLDINEFLKDYDNYDGIFIDWLMYNANSQIKKEKGLVRNRFTQTVPFLYYRGQLKGKCIIQPKRIIRMLVHFPMIINGLTKIVDSDFNIMEDSHCNPSTDKIIIDHYFTKSYEEWVQKINKGSCVPNFERKMEEFFIFNPNLKEIITQ